MEELRKMLKKRSTNRKGFTLVELMVAAAFLGIVALSVGIVLVDTQRSWNVLYGRIYSEVAADAEMAKRTFDSVIRKASSRDIVVDPYGRWVEACYYQDSDSTYLDRYARFTAIGNQLQAEYGTIDAEHNTIPSSTQTLCYNVSSCVFISGEFSVQMILRLENESATTTVVSSAVAHN